MPELRKQGINYLAPAIPMLLKNEDGKFVPSDYAKAAKENGFKLISWSLEREGPLTNGGGWYSTNLKVDNDGDIYEILDALAQDVGIVGLFSDWPATVTYYANCKKP